MSVAIIKICIVPIIITIITDSVGIYQIIVFLKNIIVIDEDLFNSLMFSQKFTPKNLSEIDLKS